ncbi:MAG: hypothetical protein LBL49_05410 [Clostridiales Family XIII bacterium]|nr:hypothetical protein [Clostridiales Family XIII bacterium]
MKKYSTSRKSRLVVARRKRMVAKKRKAEAELRLQILERAERARRNGRDMPSAVSLSIALAFVLVPTSAYAAEAGDYVKAADVLPAIAAQTPTYQPDATVSDYYDLLLSEGVNFVGYEPPTGSGAQVNDYYDALLSEGNSLAGISYEPVKTPDALVSEVSSAIKPAQALEEFLSTSSSARSIAESHNKTSAKTRTEVAQKSVERSSSVGSMIALEKPSAPALDMADPVEGNIISIVSLDLAGDEDVNGHVAKAGDKLKETAAIQLSAELANSIDEAPADKIEKADKVEKADKIAKADKVGIETAIAELASAVAAAKGEDAVAASSVEKDNALIAAIAKIENNVSPADSDSAEVAAGDDIIVGSSDSAADENGGKGIIGGNGTVDGIDVDTTAGAAGIIDSDITAASIAVDNEAGNADASVGADIIAGSVTIGGETVGSDAAATTTGTIGSDAAVGDAAVGSDAADAADAAVGDNDAAAGSDAAVGDATAGSDAAVGDNDATTGSDTAVGNGGAAGAATDLAIDNTVAAGAATDLAIDNTAAVPGETVDVDGIIGDEENDGSVDALWEEGVIIGGDDDEQIGKGRLEYTIAFSGESTTEIVQGEKGDGNEFELRLTGEDGQSYSFMIYSGARIDFTELPDGYYKASTGYVPRGYVIDSFALGGVRTGETADFIVIDGKAESSLDVKLKPSSTRIFAMEFGAEFSMDIGLIFGIEEVLTTEGAIEITDAAIDITDGAIDITDGAIDITDGAIDISDGEDGLLPGESDDPEDGLPSDTPGKLEDEETGDEEGTDGEDALPSGAPGKLEDEDEADGEDELPTNAPGKLEDDEDSDDEGLTQGDPNGNSIPQNGTEEQEDDGLLPGEQGDGGEANDEEL